MVSLNQELHDSRTTNQVAGFDAASSHASSRLWKLFNRSRMYAHLLGGVGSYKDSFDLHEVCNFILMHFATHEMLLFKTILMLEISGGFR